MALQPAAYGGVSPAAIGAYNGAAGLLGRAANGAAAANVEGMLNGKVNVREVDAGVSVNANADGSRNFDEDCNGDESPGGNGGAPPSYSPQGQNGPQNGNGNSSPAGAGGSPAPYSGQGGQSGNGQGGQSGNGQGGQSSPGQGGQSSPGQGGQSGSGQGGQPGNGQGGQSSPGQGGESGSGQGGQPGSGQGGQSGSGQGGQSGTGQGGQPGTGQGGQPGNGQMSPTSASPDNLTTSQSVEAPRCTLQGGPAHMIYFPPNVQPGQNGVGADGMVTTMGTTLNPKSCYMSVSTLYACITINGETSTVGPTYSNTMIPFESSEISTQCAQTSGAAATTGSGQNNGATQVNWSQYASPTGSSANACPIVQPAAMTTMVPEWGNAMPHWSVTFEAPENCMTSSAQTQPESSPAAGGVGSGPPSSSNAQAVTPAETTPCESSNADAEANTMPSQSSAAGAEQNTTPCPTSDVSAEQNTAPYQSLNAGAEQTGSPGGYYPHSSNAGAIGAMATSNNGSGIQPAPYTGGSISEREVGVVGWFTAAVALSIGVVAFGL